MKFSKPPYPTSFFSDEIWVNCPKCANPAIVKTELPKYIVPTVLNAKSICHCSHCGFIEKDNEKWFCSWVGFIKRACGHCGSPISNLTDPTKKPYPKSEVTCDSCQTTRSYENQWLPHFQGEATDPYFGFPLWLQTAFKEHTLWVYNLRHLDYLKEYVESTLREDDQRFKYSMITNLPKWVKTQKNREKLSRKLTQLKKEFAPYTQ
ncbi:hypothetical protein KFE98_14800 [bacterium SCSIO 12741]|nr:hypothetical protein KFE98_14800 [bacterium SCSIO 12741]